MSQEQRIELSRQEVLNTVSVGIWFEIILMQMLMRLSYRNDPTTGHVRYAFTEVADECRHSTMFAMLIDRLGGTPYRQKFVWHNLGQALPFVLTGPSMWVATLIGEEIFDSLQREHMRDENIQPLVRAVMRIHVTEEARHVRYAREDLMRILPTAARWEKEWARFVVSQGAVLMSRILTRPAQYKRAGLDPAVAVPAARANPRQAEVKRRGAERLVRFLREADLIGGPTERFWRRSGFIG
jgi:hypothetical protein